MIDGRAKFKKMKTFKLKIVEFLFLIENLFNKGKFDYKLKLISENDCNKISLIIGTNKKSSVV